MLGDNRENSLGSRYSGTVPREKIVGRARAVVRTALGSLLHGDAVKGIASGEWGMSKPDLVAPVLWHTTGHSQFAIRHSQFATRNSPHFSNCAGEMVRCWISFNWSSSEKDTPIAR